MENLRICNDEHGSGSYSGTCVEASTMNMDPVIWSKMPNHVLDHVLSFLPFWTILKLQCVSSKWRKNLKSTVFLAKWVDNSPAEVLFLMFTDHWHIQAAAAYNPSLNKWHLVPLSHSSNVIHDYHMITAAGGLVCTEEVAWPNRALVISNPINRSYRKLPPMMDMKSPYVVGMMVNADRSGYRVLVAQDGDSLVSQHYDSKSNSWKMNSTLDSKVAMLAGMATVKGFLFCLSFWPLGLIAYNIEEATWHDMEVKMPTSISSPHLIHNNGDLFLVAGVEEFGQMMTIQIWKVDFLCKECIKIEQMPDCFFQKFSWTVGGEHFSCMGEAGLVCFSDGVTLPILMYNMNSSRWWWLPPCPLHLSSPKFLSKYAHNPLSPLGFPVQPCFVVKA
ncbi:hypothetical protein GOP47_0023124 [Adiantum capillus-veneris]|uniref:F-box domain-containing protein n=1 Tax=Adiantum capillus-veneris TaxID=13818 RepID=A0A9D4U751_ADICA|nr:hypothetical protein GOP47_0023124 [Adiantum capillus-veneris]